MCKIEHTLGYAGASRKEVRLGEETEDADNAGFRRRAFSTRLQSTTKDAIVRNRWRRYFLSGCRLQKQPRSVILPEKVGRPRMQDPFAGEVVRVSSSILERVQAVVAEQLGVDPSEVTLDAEFVKDLNADSLDLVELIMQLEEEFGIEISDEEAANIVTVRDAINFIEEHLNKQ